MTLVGFVVLVESSGSGVARCITVERVAMAWGKMTGVRQQREVYTVQCIGEVPTREISYTFCIVVIKEQPFQKIITTVQPESTVTVPKSNLIRKAVLT